MNHRHKFRSDRLKSTPTGRSGRKKIDPIVRQKRLKKATMKRMMEMDRFALVHAKTLIRKSLGVNNDSLIENDRRRRKPRRSKRIGLIDVKRRPVPDIVVLDLDDDSHVDCEKDEPSVILIDDEVVEEEVIIELSKTPNVKELVVESTQAPAGEEIVMKLPTIPNIEEIEELTKTQVANQVIVESTKAPTEEIILEPTQKPFIEEIVGELRESALETCEVKKNPNIVHRSAVELINSKNPSWKESFLNPGCRNIFANVFLQGDKEIFPVSNTPYIDLSESSDVEVVAEVKADKDSENLNSEEISRRKIKKVEQQYEKRMALLTKTSVRDSKKKSNFGHFTKSRSRKKRSKNSSQSPIKPVIHVIDMNKHSSPRQEVEGSRKKHKKLRWDSRTVNIHNPVLPVIYKNKDSSPMQEIEDPRKNDKKSQWDSETVIIQSKEFNLEDIGGNVHSFVNKTILPNSGLRPIIIDGSNVAFQYTQNRYFSVKGLSICIDYFQQRGHRVIAFIPKFRERNKYCDDPKKLKELINKRVVICTPSRFIDGKLISAYDDRYVIQTAVAKGGIIVTTDNYTDLLNQHAAWDEAIKYKLLNFTWVDDMIMFPEDPLGKNGPKLDEFLKFS